MKRQRKPDPLLDDDNELAADAQELDFNAEPETQPIGELRRDQRFTDPERSREAGLTEASLPDEGPTDDDMTPETLLNEDGARSPGEAGGGRPNDETLRTVGAEEIGGGYGLDEAEMGRVRPLDGQPWDGDPSERLRPRAEAGEDFPATEDEEEDED